MLTEPFNPRDEKDALYGAVCHFYEQWEHNPTTAILDLCDATERADNVLKTLEKEENLDRDTRLQVVQLKILLNTARQTLESIRGEPLTPVNVYPIEESPEPMPDAVFLAGTILDCPSCGEGLYKVTQEAFTSALVRMIVP